MDEERDPANSRNRMGVLSKKFLNKQYRDTYVASHTRSVLARQMRNLRGGLSQAEFAEKLGKQKTVIARLENPAYAGWSLRTMLEIARKKGLAVFVRFVDFPTFLKYSGDLADTALSPRSYDETFEEMKTLERNASQTIHQSEALSGFFSGSREQIETGASARDALRPSNGLLPQMSFGVGLGIRLAANDTVSSGGQVNSDSPSAGVAA